VIRKNSGSATGKLLCSLNKRMSPSDFVRELDEASTISGRFGRKIKRVAWDNEEASVQHQESICEGRVFVMTERKPSDEFVARLVRLFKGELIVFGPKFSRLSSADVIDLRGRIFLGQALTILRSSSVVIAENGVYQEVAKRESSLHVGELKDGAEGHYDLWVRGADKSVAAEVQQALNLAAGDAQ
jgi:hypothetical protein